MDVSYDSREKYLKAVEDEGKKARNRMTDCLIEKYSNIIEAQKSGILDENFVLDRNHEFINSWFKIKDMSFLEDELNEVQQNQLNQYIREIKKFVKEDINSMNSIFK